MITPRYFKSNECRRELQFFVGKAERLGITELIMPILYIDEPGLHEEDPADPVMQLVKRIQWRDWTDLRWAERSSGEYRKAVNELAEELVRRVVAVEATDVVAAAVAAEALDPEGVDAPGVLERLVALEEAMPRWSETIERLTAEIQGIGEVMQVGHEEFERGDARGKGFAARLSVARRIAQQLAEPVDRIETLGQAFAADLTSIDAGLRLILTEAPEEVRRNPGSLNDVCTFLRNIRDLSKSAREGLGSVASMVRASEGVEGMSKDMRPVMRKLRTSLRAMSEAQQITDSWVALVDETGLDCSETRPA